MSSWLNLWRELSPKNRIAIAAGTVLILSVAALAAWWLLRPAYGVLFTRIDGQDAAEIMAKLQQWQIPFRRGKNGALLIPTAEVLDTRMRLVSAGIPNHGTVGFELFDKTDYGMTAFAQHINYQRALQGELERTIISLKGVRDARVALSLPKKSLFAAQQEPPKGSVTLSLRPGTTLSQRQIKGIQQLVATAVRGLAATDVVVLDDHGNVLTASGPGSAGIDSRFNAKQKYEAALHDKIEKLLVSLFGSRGFAISVDASFDYSHVKNVETRILPAGKDGNHLILEKKQSRTRRNDRGSTATSNDGKAASESDIKYLHGKLVRKTSYAPGRLRRLSVGVIVPPDMTQSQMTRLRQVVASAAGIDADRGDQLTVEAFDLPKPQQRPMTASAQTPPIKPSSAVHQETRTENAFSHLLLPAWSTVVLAACAVLLLLTLLAQLLFRLRAPRRLGAPARRALLAELNDWLEGSAGEVREHG